MYDSGISAGKMILELKNEVDVAIPIPNANYIAWLNALERLLYAGVIHEQNVLIVDDPADAIDLSSLSMPASEAPLCFDNIHTVFADDVQLIKTTVVGGYIFLDTFYKKENCLCFHTGNKPKQLTIIYFVVPAPKSVSSSDKIADGNVMLPLEFIDLAKAKLRAEAYKIANEDEIAAKWVNDYNVLLEDFKNWLASHAAQFGM